MKETTKDAFDILNNIQILSMRLIGHDALTSEEMDVAMNIIDNELPKISEGLNNRRSARIEAVMHEVASEGFEPHTEEFVNEVNARTTDL